MADDASKDRPEGANDSAPPKPQLSVFERGAAKTKRIARAAESAVWKNVAPKMYGDFNVTPEQRRAYIDEMRHDVEGWNGPGAFKLIDAVADHQQQRGVFGAACEIGVHHGQMFIYLMMLLREREQGLAIDLFDNQQLNLDRSGRGDLQILSENVGRHVAPAADRVKTHIGDSNKLEAGQIASLVGDPVRLFSIDGGHWRDIVLNDLYVAADALHDCGVVILDDVFNKYFPGVGEGLAAYTHDATPKRFKNYRNTENRLRPFAIGCNKVLLCLEKQWKEYNYAFAAQYFGETRRVEVQGWNTEKIFVLEL